MCKFEVHGLTLDYEKCVIRAKSMAYMGESLTGEGLQISKRRVEAVVDAPRPQNQSEVRSFLGSAQFCAKSIPGFSTISSPLWDLTSTGKSWKWETKEEEAFEQIKKLLKNAGSLQQKTKCLESFEFFYLSFYLYKCMPNAQEEQEVEEGEGGVGSTQEEEIQELPSSNQGELNCLAPSTLGQEEEVDQLAKELDLTFSSEDSAFESDMDDLL